MANNFDPSIYKIQEMVNDIAKMYVPDESENTLALGLFGYIGDIASLQIQNDIILNSELGNEIWPSRAKYEKNVIAHSIIQNITNINAKPAVIQVYLGFEEAMLDKLFIDNIFTIDKDYVFRIGDFDFHLEYDINLQRSLVVNNQYAYSAKYDMSISNNLSSITNPYTNTPFIQLEQGKRHIFIPCQLMQVTYTTEHRKIITSSSVDNKTFDFSFSDQLADFQVAVTDRGLKPIYLTPVFTGAPIENDVDKYCYYDYIDANTIRVRFDSLSYLPTLNADVDIYVKTTKGEAGNFEHDEDAVYISLSSEKYEYKNLTTILRTTKSSTGGEDRKSVEELRRLLPKEALSRGSITNTQDLQNYFNTIILDSNKLRIEVMKKISNDFEKRSYYAYLVMKDKEDNVVPTNTINIEVPKSLFDNPEYPYATHDNRKYILKPGCHIVYENGVGHVYKENSLELEELLKDDKKNFIYTVPFMLVVNADPLYVSYYLAAMNNLAFLTFSYINQESPVQFITTNITWTRQFQTDNDKYVLNMELGQNMSDGKEIVQFDNKGNIVENRLKVVMVLYNDDADEPYRYAYGEVVEKDKTNGRLKVKFDFETTDQINDDNKIKIKGVYVPKSNPSENPDDNYGYFTNHVSAEIYVLYQSIDGAEYGRYGLDNTIIPEENLKGWTVTNMYTVNGGVNFFYNYSQVMSSIVTDTSVADSYGDEELGFTIKSVPVVRYSYMNDANNQYLIDEINYEKAYIDNATQLLENNFLIDFKFFNTYGKSTLYSIDKSGNKLVDRTHLTLKFEVKLLKTSDNNTKEYIIADIRNMIEDLNDLDSLHIPNLITTITNTYRNSIEYIEFLGFNDYDEDIAPGIQHLYKQENDDVSAVPEFLCVNVREDGLPDIDIRLA